MRIALALLLAVHGLIHLMGFVSTFGLARVPQMTGRTLITLPGALTRSIGLLWLLACFVLLGAAVLLLLGSGRWWQVAAPGVLLSQLLVLYAWPEAKAGTVANVLLAVAIVLARADAHFQREGDEAVRSLFARVPTSPASPVTAGELAPLPMPVRRWLETSGVVGRPRVRTARLLQRGGLRTAPDQPFMPAEARQYFTLDEPGFVWRVRVHMMRVLPLVGRDAYLDGRGRMRISAASLVPVVDASGPEIDQGTLLRFLGELVWIPSAALSPYIHWEPIDDTHARATMSWRGVSASGVFTFDAKGRFLQMSAQRYMGGGPSPKLETWVVPAREWREVHGYVIPTRGDVVWKLASGDFHAYAWEILDVEYDRAELYPPG
ncbi:hypothetical protein HPC49_23485 [Pyxidicoccus fallax]|uniref:Uncharacterized protein n=1 Tax=Pyxidicoccus fallax TaxID=394095 RepID=A0A848M050_9BACT|nr:DUF6544 family protein [Pyxidicoccus fallax]NMO22764.1 hypothetical protein [Pyxidicoccus fallax]NPC81178.1 hypothetical protein [Pyxidicoccus fallax]